MLKSLGRMLALTIVLIFAIAVLPSQVLASVPLNGKFTAIESCKATTSIAKTKKQGNVRLQLGQTYSVVAKNKDRATHYLVEVDTARPSQRWVPVSCGSLVLSVPPTPKKPAAPIPEAPLPSSAPAVTTGNDGKDGNDYVLALSWQPAFCETKPEKAECRILAAAPDRFEATHLALHGLWPQPNGNFYCDVSQEKIDFDKDKQWEDLPAIEDELSRPTWERLQTVMPGTKSFLHRHEWIKHGTCSGTEPDVYFAESIALVDAFNASPLQALLTENIEKAVSISDLEAALATFDPDAGRKVQVDCSDAVLGEFRVNLRGDITATSSVAELLRNAPFAPKDRGSSCLIDDARD